MLCTHSYCYDTGGDRLSIGCTRTDVRRGWWPRLARCPGRCCTRRWLDLCPARLPRLPPTLLRLRCPGLPLLWRPRLHSSSAAALRPPSSLARTHSLRVFSCVSLSRGRDATPVTSPSHSERALPLLRRVGVVWASLVVNMWLNSFSATIFWNGAHYRKILRPGKH